MIGDGYNSLNFGLNTTDLMIQRLFFVFLFFTCLTCAYAQELPAHAATFLEEFKKQNVELMAAYNVSPANGRKALQEILGNAPADKKLYYETMRINDAYFYYNLKEGLKTIKKLKPRIDESKEKYLKFYYYFNTAYFHEAFGNYELFKINIELAQKYASDDEELKQCEVALCKEYLQIGMPGRVIDLYEELLKNDLKNNDIASQQFDYYMLTQAYILDNKLTKARTCLDLWAKLIQSQKNGTTKKIELEHYQHLFSAKCGIAANLKSEVENIHENLKIAAKADFSDMNFLTIYLDTKQKYFEWMGMPDSSTFYREKLAVSMDTQTKRNLQIIKELEKEEQTEKQENRIKNAFWIAALALLLGACVFLFFVNQKKINKINLESKEHVLAKYEAILKEKYTVINQAETQLNELYREIKDANFEKKIRNIKDSIRLSEVELKFFNELNDGELITYENLRKSLPNLTESEIKVVFLILKNKPINGIADILNISPKAAENHRYRIRKKLSLSLDQSLETALKEHLSKFKG